MSQESPLRTVLETEFSQGVATDWDALDRYLNHPRFPNRARDFKRELADAILNHTLSPKEFECLTVIDKDSQEDVDGFLLEELWMPLFPDEPVRMP